MLPVAPLPEVDFPTIQVSGSLPGASPETMASSVATPLERQFGRIAGLTELTSTSSLGTTNIVLQFDLNRNIDAAARDVQAAINAARSQLPANLPSNPIYKKVNPADAPILILALTSTTLRRGLIYDAASSDPGAEALADWRRRPGDGGRQCAARGARGVEPQCAEQLWNRPRTNSHHAQQGQREPPQGRSRRSNQCLGDQRHRPTAERGPVPAR